MWWPETPARAADREIISIRLAIIGGNNIIKRKNHLSCIVFSSTVEGCNGLTGGLIWNHQFRRKTLFKSTELFHLLSFFLINRKDFFWFPFSTSLASDDRLWCIWFIMRWCCRWSWSTFDLWLLTTTIIKLLKNHTQNNFTNVNKL